MPLNRDIIMFIWFYFPQLRNRLTAEQALQHPYLADYSDPSDEPTSEPFDDSFEDANFSVIEWKSKLLAVLRLIKNLE